MKSYKCLPPRLYNATFFVPIETASSKRRSHEASKISAKRNDPVICKKVKRILTWVHRKISNLGYIPRIYPED